MRFDEQILSCLHSLYCSFGYRQYKVSSFEEYDLYAQNKNFLASEQVLTFTDTDGRLMALKPDVTLSIIKNTAQAGETRKLFYAERVYRATRGDGFREIPQAGLECIGTPDSYAQAEVVMLAVKSLAQISPAYVLDVSNLGILSGVLADADTAVFRQVLDAFGQKNRGALREIQLSEQTAELLSQLLAISGELPDALAQLRELPLPAACKPALAELESLSALLCEAGVSGVRLDFSVVNDMDYYNALVFRGFVSGVPAGVLSGGRYDNLLQKMGKRGGALGFAVYLDELERLYPQPSQYDVDTLVLYDEKTDPACVLRSVQALQQSGVSVRAQADEPTQLRWRRLVRLDAQEA